MYVLHVGTWKATIKIGESRGEMCSITARGEAFYIHNTHLYILLCCANGLTVVYYCTCLLVIYKSNVSRSHYVSSFGKLYFDRLYYFYKTDRMVNHHRVCAPPILCLNGHRNKRNNDGYTVYNVLYYNIIHTHTHPYTSPPIHRIIITNGGKY